ncbi:hypothetical protein E2C01_021923 [Portunus trituberculatus]|uniref:Uncharacterized protein n=1 Tax=Portunus trituberculatus TaxID=210409 RepID=A0A5B7E697_PORTR|nr:hypothetical protein [Portunus trituberculatus]
MFSNTSNGGSPTCQETIPLSEEAQPTLGPWTGFKPVHLETPRTPKHAVFQCTTVAPGIEHSGVAGYLTGTGRALSYHTSSSKAKTG